MANNLLIPLNAKILGKPVSEYKKDEAKAKPKAQPRTSPITPSAFGKAVPIVGRNGETKFSVMDALVEAKAQNKVLASLPAADEYVLKNGSYYWTGVLFAYCQSGKKLGSELSYKDGNGVEYLFQVPNSLRAVKGDEAIRLNHGYHSDGKPYFEFNQDKGLWVVSIHSADDLIQNGLLEVVSIHRNNGWYQTDGQKLPNGRAASDSDKNARYWYQVDNESFIGLLIRGLGTRRDVDADRRPSLHAGVLVFE